MILPVASKTVLVGSSDYQLLLDGVQLINLGLTKKEDKVIMFKSKTTIIFILNAFIC